MKTPIPFVIDPEPKVWWPVRVSVPVDAGFAEFAFEAQLRVYSEEDYARLLPEAAPDAAQLDLRAVLARNAELIPQFVSDWRGVTDPAVAADQYLRWRSPGKLVRQIRSIGD